MPLRTGVVAALVALVAGMGITIFLGVLAMLGFTLANGHPPTIEAGQPFNTLLLLLFYGVSGWVARGRLRATGLHVFRRLGRRDALAIVVGFIALIVAHVLTGLQLVLTHQTQHVQVGFEHFSVAGRTPLLTDLSIATTAATLVLIAPVVEETIFRGLLFGALMRPLGVFFGALVSAVLFGLVHGDAVLFPTLAALGFINALAYAATENLTVPVILHALNNAFATAFLVAHAYKM